MDQIEYVNLLVLLTQVENTLLLPIFDRNRMLTEQGIPVFPDDYPDSNAYCTSILSYTKKKQRKPSPHSNVYDPQDATKWLQLLGSNSKHCIVQRIVSSHLAGHAKLVTIQLMATFGHLFDKHATLAMFPKDDEGATTISKQHAEQVPIIGYITSTCYSFRDGQGYAIATITWHAWQAIQQGTAPNEDLVLHFAGKDYWFPCTAHAIKT